MLASISIKSQTKIRLFCALAWIWNVSLESLVNLDFFV